MKNEVCRAAAFFSAAALLWPATELQLQEQRGRRIYLQGVSAKPIVAIVNGSGEVSAAIVPCAGCHGAKGQGGQTEGGITPSDITWAALTKPYPMNSLSGRRYPPYDASKLKRAITLGLDSGGNTLSPAMPHYQLTLRDAADLVAYLKVLGTAPEPGLTDTSIRIGAVLPADAPPGIGDAIKAALTAYFEQINKNGGIYNRRIELRFVTLPPSPKEAAAALAAFLDREQTFALSSSMVAGLETIVTPLLKLREIPLIGALSLSPETDYPLNPYVFYLLPGVAGETQSLAEFVSTRQTAEHLSVAILYDAEPVFRSAALGIEKLAADQHWAHAELIPVANQSRAAVVAKLKNTPVSDVFCLMPTEFAVGVIREVHAAGLNLTFLIPGSLASEKTLDTIRESNATAWLAFSELPEDAGSAAVEEYRELASKYSLPSTHVPTQWAAISGAKLLIEALQRAGRDVTERSLISTLESFRQVRTGLLPPITFGPNRHVGIVDAHIVSIDPASGKLILAGKPR